VSVREAGARRLSFDHKGMASLDGTWDFFTGDHPIEALAGLEPEPINVPGLWETQGYLELDGAAWYRTSFDLEDSSNYWTLHFGAVMDIADVYLNGEHLGSHDSAFTPFSVDATHALKPGPNELAVRVFDPAVDDPDHVLSAHGKQGWANWVFPSRPSLYMTYGGIWQSVALRRHGPLLISQVFVNGDPDELTVEVTIENRSDRACTALLACRTVGLVKDTLVNVGPRERSKQTVELGATAAGRWSPASPKMHRALVDVSVEGELSDARSIRYGLRKIEIEGTRLLVDGTPYRMKSVLVQGFRSDGLYAEGSREAIEDEVRKARAMGFNMVRLHIKAFDPVYLDVCDELGMFVQCDIPVAEPIAHDQLGEDTQLAQRCRRAAREQVIRDRNHPSILLWAAMNELCLDRIEARSWEGYEQFVRVLMAEIQEADGTRPVIENDWVEPDPDRVFVSPILTAHWYGRLHAEYLETIDKKAVEWAEIGKPLYITEFGDWGLPAMPVLEAPPFWDTRELYAAGLAASLWPASVARFVTETQRYQGLSDRLQIEVFRRHDHLGGYCLTELTDVPHELNGVLDLDRNPKRLAVAEITRANQTVLPMLRLPSLVVNAGSTLTAELVVANDGPGMSGVSVEVWFGDTPGPAEAGVMKIPSLPGYRAARWGDVTLTAPEVPGGHDLIVRLVTGGTEIARNRYPTHVVPQREPVGPVRLVGEGPYTAALSMVGAEPSDRGPVVITENSLDAEAGAVAAERLAAGDSVIILAQEPSAAGHYPVLVQMAPLATAWGSSIFRFTNDEGWIPSLPRRNVLTTEDSTIHPGHVILNINHQPFPDNPIVFAYKPAPDPLTGTLVGCTSVGAGRLIFCQYRVCEQAATGDAAACAMLADLIRAPERLARAAEKERITKDDGRSLQLWWLPPEGRRID
jgi:hypothetical protein